jgi:2-polyprenyl-6-hydroxyphenyl methylase/3-demethylubiquinone-9 3-methyltransferase
MKKFHQNDFDIKEYDNFYEHHFFESLPDNVALNAHRVVPRINWALDVAKELKPKSVLDLGCLEGYTALTIANHVDSVERIVGVDLSADGIELANSRKGLIKASSEFIQQTIEEYLQNCTDKFDMIICFEVIEHVLDPELLVELMNKVKSEDGQVLISTPSFEAPTFGKNDVVNKCHIRLYTMKDEDYEEMTDRPDPDTGKTYMRTASSMPKLLLDHDIIEMGVYSELINVRYF